MFEIGPFHNHLRVTLSFFIFTLTWTVEWPERLLRASSLLMSYTFLLVGQCRNYIAY